ncbi:MAG: hypothetical protein GEU88_03535 [Solirubrobacterales bacterium]|nr:hypothetical protein [Solirubrobacterales bacterium]
MGRLDPARARPRRRLPRAARSLRAGSASARQRPAPRAGYRHLRGGGLRAPGRPARRARHPRGRGAARDRAGARALRRCRRPPGDGGKRQAPDPTPLTWVETDSSDSYLPDVNLEFNRWTCLSVARAEAEPAIVADVTGRTCALDVIVPDAELPRVEPGDVLAFLDTGAYQDPGATNFNALPRPGTVLVTGGDAALIRRQETLDDVFARDLVPERLRHGSPALDGAVGWRATGLDHVSVTSADLDRSLAFYRDLLGLELRGRGEAEGGEFEITGIPDPSVRWADLELSHGQVLELIEYVEPRGTPSRPLPNDPGATHISLRVADIDAVHSRLREAAVSVVSEPVRIASAGAWQGARVFYASDPDGVTVELIQPAPLPGQ